MGWFFAARPGWTGEPVNREPGKHSALLWVDPAVPSADLVAYTWAGLRAYREGVSFAIHFQGDGSPVHYHPQFADELRRLALASDIAARTGLTTLKPPELGENWSRLVQTNPRSPPSVSVADGAEAPVLPRSDQNVVRSSSARPVGETYRTR